MRLSGKNKKNAFTSSRGGSSGKSRTPAAGYLAGNLELCEVLCEKHSRFACHVGMWRLLLLIHGGIPGTPQQHNGRGPLCHLPVLPTNRILARLRLCFLRAFGKRSQLSKVSAPSRSFVPWL